MTTEILEKYPAPWRVETSYPKKGTARIWLIDYNGNHIATIHGETRSEAEELGTALCQFPEMLFKIQN
jgi:hypothetical protein